MNPAAGAAAIVLAGGSGTRLGADTNKVYLPLGDRPVIAWSLRTVARTPGIDIVVLVVRPEDRDQAAEIVEPGVAIVMGGATRQRSELAGLRHLADRIDAGELDVVLIHDGARPLLSGALVAEVLRVARESGGAVPGLPRRDLAVAGRGATLAGPPPGCLVAVQTPQGFWAAPMHAAYELAESAGFAGTDTASCMERFAPHVPIRHIAGERRNFKITYPFDLRVAEQILAT